MGCTLSRIVAVIVDRHARVREIFGTWMWTGPGRPPKARFTACSSTSQVFAGSSKRKEPLVVASNIFCELGVRLTPEVSFRAPLPVHSSDEKPEIASTG